MGVCGLSKFITVFVVALLVLSFATNPGYSDFERRVKAEVRQDLGADGGLSAAVVDLAIDAVGVGRFIVYKDYKFFSFYTISYPGCSPDNFIGAFGGFKQVYLKGERKLVN